ncbi:LON peptidase substrate-binding domain-containing protein [Gloeobacter kilaueensis]|uniref:Peptidase S16 lon domain-containing protein n=1 Tax=Gloeobacter kilaueensis (strain ATCC BAA-2537 / CCAP 1431/1 / ULC 316 / JS1) TaxID=1183438 RepID=U5QFS8_GLOK1|nr:LON peptidase substrate-binding domain-containing protein [Gloeobacter kilaueensis]AGY56540.1 peptidase S16 lon domain-containing protein [Gloeobacter kilaueensis JS1]
MSLSFSLAVQELPLFPLPDVVLFPGRPLPLHIFEPRYRMMMNTVLDTDCRFGVLLWDGEARQPARVGCCAEITQVDRLPDHRMNVMTVGVKRFRVLEYTRQKPYRVGLVQWLEDEPLESDLSALSFEAKKLLADVVRLSSKLMEKPIPLPTLPEDPLELSYWIGGSFYGAAEEQQALLELQNTSQRLQREIDILQTTLKHLAARTVLKDTLS